MCNIRFHGKVCHIIWLLIVAVHATNGYSEAVWNNAAAYYWPAYT